LYRIGNDVVDLTKARNREKALDARFIDRVFSAAEREELFSAADRTALLWALWAGKETAYKIVRKLYYDARFAPRRYSVTLYGAQILEKGGVSSTGVMLSGKVDTPCDTAHIGISVDADFIHCIGADDPCALDSVIWKVDRVSPPEDPFVDESSFVRRQAIGHLSMCLHLNRKDIEIKRFKDASGLGPPLVYVGGSPAEIGISLSHDGQFTAYAFNIAAS
jgi:phosphopantetheinyl transferase (holo-ACP synthase)